MAYKIVGPIERRDADTLQQRFWEVDLVENQWVITAHGWTRYGKGMSMIYYFDYDPEATEAGYQLVNGYNFIYHSLEDFIANQKVLDEDLLVTPEGAVPCPEWAVACLLD